MDTTKPRLVTFGCSFTYGTALADGPPNSNTPSKFSWPSILSEKLEIDCINKASPGASNLEILYHILNTKFEENDIVIILWSFFARGTVINKDGLEKYGLWLPNFKKWLGTNSYDHLKTISWYYMHHAELYLNSLKVKNYCYSIEKGLMEQSRPDYIKIKNLRELNGLYKNMPDLANDNAHPGPITHENFANLVYQNLLKENTNGIR